MIERMKIQERNRNMVHGGDIYRNCISLDYSVNINPLGIPASVEAALREAVTLCSRYPDIRQEKLKAAIAGMDKVSADEILCGNGASELFPAILHALKPKKILIPVPSFYGYEWAAGVEDCEVSYFPLREQDNFVLGEDFIEAFDKETELIYLANPNNPTGQLIPPEILKGILKRCQELDIIVVVDECFLPFCEEAGFYEEMEAGMKCGNLIQVRAFTKTFAIPGVRLGYLICRNREVCQKIARQLPEWNLSVFAQMAGCAAAKETEFIGESRKLIKEQRSILIKELASIGFRVYPSRADYILFYTELPLYELLLKKQILIRNCENYRGLSKGYYRIAVRGQTENERLISALREVMGK